MGLISRAWNRYQYAKMAQRIRKYPEKTQQLLGRQIYEEAYELLKHEFGDCLGGCAVVFSCAYPGHVQYHIQSVLDKRLEDKDDPTVFAETVLTGNDTWCCTVIVRSSTPANAKLTADASAMSAVLRAATVSGDFVRYLAELDDIAKSSDTISIPELAEMLRDSMPGNGEVPVLSETSR